MPRQVPVRWVAFGDCFESVCCDCNPSSGGGTTDTVCNVEFNTVSDMEISTTTDWWEATCWNYEGSDGIVSTWDRTDNPALVANGSDIRQTAGGIKVMRTFIREGGLV